MVALDLLPQGPELITLQLNLLFSIFFPSLQNFKSKLGFINWDAINKVRAGRSCHSDLHGRGKWRRSYLLTPHVGS